MELLPEASQPVLRPLDAQGQPVEGPAVLPPAGEPAQKQPQAFDIHDYGF